MHLPGEQALTRCQMSAFTGSRDAVATSASRGALVLNRAHLRRPWYLPRDSFQQTLQRAAAAIGNGSATVSRKQTRACRALPREDGFGYEISAYEQVITFLTADGRVVRIPGSSTHQVAPARRQYPRMPSWDEQKLCIGASFVLAATNGHNPSRRINLEGFCQSVDYLFDSIEDTVRSTRGEILVEERELKSGVHEVLKVTVAIPFLWGVPPQLERLSTAINSGGGVVHRMYHQWVVL